MLIVTDYRRLRLKIVAQFVDGAWNAGVRIRRTLSEMKSHVEQVTSPAVSRPRLKPNRQASFGRGGGSIVSRGNMSAPRDAREETVRNGAARRRCGGRALAALGGASAV